ncbi:Haspin protein kinase, partial [Pseudoloma neurophilia]
VVNSQIDHVKYSKTRLNITKIAEASYSDVYLVNNLVYKIIPLNQEFNVEDFLRECMAHILLSNANENTKQSHKVNQILQRLGMNVISSKINHKDNVKTTKYHKKNKKIEDKQDMASVLPIFDFFFLAGDYNPRLLRAWNHFAKTKKSNNPHPSHVNNYVVNAKNSNETDEKIKSCKYACMILPFHGKDLESFEIINDREHLQILLSIVQSLQNLEKTNQFEHRDLHWGNILIERNITPQNIRSISSKKDKIDSSDLENSVKRSQKQLYDYCKSDSSNVD